MLTHAHLTGSLHPWAGLTRAHIFIHVWALRCLDLREHPLTHTSIPQSIAHAHSYRHLPPHDYPWTHILAPHSCSHTLTQASVCTCTYTRVVACSLHMHTQHTLMSTCVVTCVHTHAYEDIDQAGCRVERGWGGGARAGPSSSSCRSQVSALLRKIPVPTSPATTMLQPRAPQGQGGLASLRRGGAGI